MEGWMNDWVADWMAEFDRRRDGWMNG